MNNFRFRSVLLLLPAFLMLAACSKKKSAAEEAARNLTSHIAPDLAYSMSVKTLLDKSGVSDGSSIPKMIHLMMGEQLSYLTDESKTGIRFEGKSFLLFTFDDLRRSGGSGILVFGIKDAGVFSKLVAEGTSLNPAEKDGYKYVTSPSGELGISWNKKYGLLVFNENTDAHKKDMEIRLGELMKYSETKGDKQNEAYTAFFESDTDISAIFNFESLSKTNELVGSDATEWLKETYAGSYFLHTLQFDTDKVTSKNRFFSLSNQPNQLELLSKNGVPADYLNFISDTEAPLGFITSALSVKEAQRILEKTGGSEWERESQRVSRNYGLNLSELIDGFSGEMALSFTGIERVKKSYNWIDDEGQAEEEVWYANEPVFSLTLGLNGDYIPRIFDSISETKKEGGYYHLDDLYIVFTANKAFVSNDESLVSQVATQGSLRPFTARNGLEKEALKKPIFGYFDFTALYKFLMPESPDIARFLKDFDYASASGNGDETTVEIHFKNTGKNSLFILTEGIFNMFGNQAI